MADAVIGALRIVLGADSAALDKGLKDAQKGLADFGSSIAKAGAVAATAFVAAGLGIAVAVKHSVDLADKLSKMSQKIGVPVEELSALRVAAELSDVSMESLGKSLGKLSKTMVEAAAKPTSEAANAFRALGISVTNSDGTLKSSSTVMTDVAGKFEGLKDGAGKTAVSMALFGRAGAELIPMLNMGKAGLEAAKEEAAKFGIVLSKETGKAAEEFNDNLKRLKYVQEGIATQIAAAMLPSLQNFSANLVLVAKEAGLLKIVGEALGGMLTGMLSAVARVSLAWNRLGVEWGTLREFMQTDIFSGKVGENWKKFTDAGAETTRQMEVLRITMETAHLADAFGAIGVKAAEAAKKQGELNYGLLGGKNALDQFLASQLKHIASVQADVLTTGLAAGAKEKLRIQLQANTIASEAHIKINERLQAKIDEVATAAEQMALKLKGAQLVESATEPGEQFRQDMENNKLALEAFGATSEQIAQVHKKAAEAIGATWEQQSANLAGSFVAVTKAFGKNNKEMAVAGKAFGIVQAVINTYIAYTKALASLPPPLNFVAAGAALASGLAAVATIAATPIPAKHGADFIVPGGIGGGDSVPFNAMVEPGERIQITPNSARAGQSNGAVAQDHTITIRFEGDDLDIGQKLARKIVTALNGVMRDGARLKVA